MLSAGLDTNPIIVDYSHDMPKYLKEQYLGMFVKYTGNNTDEYKNGYTYQVSQKQNGTDTVYFFAPYFYLESLASSADTSKIIDGYQAYNDNGKKIIGQYKTSEKVITENGTFYPADDGVNAYSKVTVNIAGETAENPYIATTDSEMEAYLAAEYKDSFVRMDYAKYRVALPINATYDQAKFNYESIGIPRMCAYIDKWLGSDSSKIVLNLKITGGSGSASLTADVKFTVYKFSNSDGTYGYAASVRIDYNDGTSSEPGPVFLYHIKSGTVIDGWTADKDYNEGWTYFGGDTGGSSMETLNGVIQLLYGQNRTGQYTVAVSDALVLTNMAGSEVDNKYVEGAVYKVTAKYVENNTYVAESPFQVGDQLAGATVYLNQQITSDEFEAMCDELAKTTDFGFYEGMFIFANIDYPLVEPEDAGPFYTPLALLFAEQRTYSSGPSGPNAQQQTYYQLGSYSLDTGVNSPVILGKKSTANGLVTVSPATPSSFTVATSITVNDVGALTVPATITKINFPTLLNAIAGKTPNFTKQSVIEAIYVPVLQASNGAYEEAQTEAELDAKIVNDNIGKIYQYTGVTGSKYKNQSLYIILED